MTDELKQWEYDRGYAEGKADILDVIRAEIASEILPFEPDTYNGIVNLGITTALVIIDKYRGVSE
jgi:hypothetical protein